MRATNQIPGFNSGRTRWREKIRQHRERPKCVALEAGEELYRLPSKKVEPVRYGPPRPMPALRTRFARGDTSCCAHTPWRHGAQNSRTCLYPPHLSAETAPSTWRQPAVTFSFHAVTSGVCQRPVPEISVRVDWTVGVALAAGGSKLLSSHSGMHSGFHFVPHPWRRAGRAAAGARGFAAIGRGTCRTGGDGLLLQDGINPVVALGEYSSGESRRRGGLLLEVPRWCAAGMSRAIAAMSNSARHAGNPPPTRRAPRPVVRQVTTTSRAHRNKGPFMVEDLEISWLE